MYNLMNWYLPIDQCIQLQNHAWVKDPSKYKTCQWILRTLTTESFRFHTENHLQETATCRTLAQYQRKISTIIWKGC